MNAVVLNNQDVEMSVRCKAFTGEGQRLHKVLVEAGASGAVLVWDEVAGHYTACHSIAARTQSRIRKLAINFWAVNHFHGAK